jgi:hypothetical protein
MNEQGLARFILGMLFAIAASVAFQSSAATVQAEQPDTGKTASSPSNMQEAFDLSARRNKLLLELQNVEKRLEKAEKEAFAGFERVATPTGSDYWESISDNVVYAKAMRDIQKDELLLYHAPGIYSVKGLKPKLMTKGECWYFRPDRKIAAGQAFTIELIHDLPEEVEKVKKGFAPHTDRARDPARAYGTRIHLTR